MGILDLIATTSYAAKMERIAAKKLGILPFQINKRQKDAIIDEAQRARLMGISAENAVENCFQRIKFLGDHAR
jgi:hypothetical protein